MSQGSGGNLYFTKREFEWARFPGVDIEEFYELDFPAMKSHVMEKLNEEKHPGLVLLHGLHGTGKTTFMKLIIEESSKPVLFLPPQIVQNITMPGLIDLVTNTFKEPIILVEDAEALLKKREGGNRDAMSVSNMLNLGDGILGNMYNMKFVCTFNCDIDEIDEAVRRPGRTIAEYEFKRLSTERTLNLYQKIHNGATPPEKSMTIAEILNDKNEKFVTVEAHKSSIGFV